MFRVFVLAFLFAASAAVAQQSPGWSTFIGAGQNPLIDPFYISPPNTNVQGSSGYTQASCTLGAGTNKVIVVLGESLYANTANDTYSVTNPTKNLTLNPFDGNCYQTQYTMVGGFSNFAFSDCCGSPLARMGDNLISNDGVAKVIIVPAIAGQLAGSSIGNLTSATISPYLGNNIATIARRLAAQGLSPTEIVWEQGEEDCAAGLSQANYAAGLTTLLSEIRSVWPAPIPIIINSAETWQANTTCAGIAAAQAAAINNSLSIYAGADTDTLGSGDRYDGTHLNGTGSAAAASLLETVIVAH